MFRPSKELANRVVEAQAESLTFPPVAALVAEDAPKPGLRRIDVTTRYIPLYDRSVDLEAVREAITERLFGLLGTLVRRDSVQNADAGKLLLTTEPDKFQHDVQTRLQERLTLAGAQTEPILRDLAKELYDWANQHPLEREEAGLELDTMHLFIRHP